MARKLKRKRLSHGLAKRRSSPGAAPGTLVIDPNAHETSIRVLAFDCQNVREQAIGHVSEINGYLGKFRNLWIDVTGLGSERVLRDLAELLKLHPLSMEDVVNVHQRAKLDRFENHLFVVARMIDGDDARDSEQLSFFVLNGILISFQERPGDCWEPLRQRIRSKHGKAVNSGVDYLLYALLDSVIDSYFPFMEKISDKVDVLEEDIAAQLSPSQLRMIHDLRGQLLALRRSLRPHRELINELIRDSSDRFSEEARVHLRDCYDHVTQLLDAADTYRELTADLRDYYMSTMNNNMSQVMKLLTIISTIFIPLSFIAGVYGMNFDGEVSPWNMPELKWYFGYPFALAIMLTVSLGLLFVFWRKRWI
jgi:magnesium transporter